jgi:hypothetical protein
MLGGIDGALRSPFRETLAWTSFHEVARLDAHADARSTYKRNPLNQGCHNKDSEVVSQPVGVVFGKQDVGNPDVFYPRIKTRQAQTFLKSLAAEISTRSVEVWCLDRSAKAGSRDG